MSVIYCEGCDRYVDTDFEESYEDGNGNLICEHCYFEAHPEDDDDYESNTNWQEIYYEEMKEFA